MGGKGSGRKKKTEEEIEQELLEGIYLLNDAIDCLYAKVKTHIQRVTYYLKTRRGLVTKDGYFDYEKVDGKVKKR